MFKISQSPYKRISRSLLKSLNTKDVEDVKKSIQYFVSTLIELLNKIEANPLVLSDFVYDEEMIFSTRLQNTNKNGLDVTITTNGILSQLLTSMNIAMGESLSEKIKDSIADLHTELSKGNLEVVQEKNSLVEILNETILLFQ